MPKYGVDLLLYTASFGEGDVPLIQKVADMGFDGVEIPLFDPGNTPVQEAKAVIEANGLGCTCCSILSPDRDLISEDPTVREQAGEYIRDCIRISEAWAAGSSAARCTVLWANCRDAAGRNRNGSGRSRACGTSGRSRGITG